MKTEAIYHRMLSEMAYAVTDSVITIRIKTAKDDIKSVVLLYGDRSSRLDPIPLEKVVMQKVASDNVSDYFEATFSSLYNRICYCFELRDTEGKVLYYSGSQFEKAPPAPRSEYFQIPYNHRADRIKVPSWMQDAIVYNIFPDSFATGKRTILDKPLTFLEDGVEIKSLHGGTIGGIRENIDYFCSLGVNTIYLNPIFKAGEYHKYDTIDYFQVDPCFGSNEEFKTLVKELHNNGLRIIIDGVFNHAGWHFPPFRDVVKNGKRSKYWSWFYRLEEPVIIPDDWEKYPNYECFGYERMMPKLALDNKEVEDYFCRVGSFWVKEFDVDGWRLDVADEIPDAFWRRFRTEIKRVKPDCALIGEVWVNSSHWLDGSMFDSTMNYDVWRHAKRFFASKDITSSEFDSRITDMRMRYCSQFVHSQMNLLDSHDVSRFFSLCGERYESYRLSIVFLFTFIGMPMLFYGDERGMKGIKEADFRAVMSWDKKNDEAFNLFKNLIALRKSNEVLNSGEFRTIRVGDDGLYIYERVNDDDSIKIALNRNDYAIELHCDNILLQEGYEDKKLDVNGFVIYR